MLVVRYAGLVPAPWKNGGGVTREALREPARGEPFGWRVSFAEVAASGPFSDFSGYERHLVLVGGAGVTLRFGDGAAVTLRETGDIARFDGGLRTTGELLRGPSLDLNLIAAKPRYDVHARVERLAGPLPVPAAPGATVLVVPLDGPVEVRDADGARVRLAERDLAAGQVRHVLADGPSRVFVAGIIDNGSS